MTIHTTRRGFLKGAATTSAVLVVGLNANGVLASGTADAVLNPFVKINADGTVTVIVKHFEMGQGVTTGLTTLIAEELDADWSKVNFEFAPANSAIYANLLFGLQGTGGSTAIANSFDQYRTAGAAARDVLVQAAAEKWSVNPESIKVENSMLSSGSHSAHFGEIAEAATSFTPPDKPKVKDISEFKLIGKNSLRRKDSSAKTDGSAKFAMDIKVPGMAYVGIIRSPKFGGKLTSFDASDAQSVAGFIDAKAMPDNEGVAVYGKKTWAVKKARDAITVEWSYSGAETRSSTEIQKIAFNALENPTYKTTDTTDFDATAEAIQGSDHTIEFDFLAPFLAHAPLEPLNCVIEPTSDGVRVYDGCQMPGLVQPLVGGVLGLSPDKVQVKTVFAGGSFGRRANPTSDYHTEAAKAFQLLGGQTPIKLVWTREDDIKGGYYRPIAAHRVKIGINDSGKITGWDHRIAAKSIMKGTAFESFVVNGIDNSSVEGVNDTHYNIPAFSVGLSDVETPMKALWWRSVGHTHTAFAMETAIDMIAEKVSRDPVELRLEMLSGDDVDKKRLSGVLKLVAEKSNWGSPVSAGMGRGVALHKSFNTYVAEVVDVSVVDGDISIDNITCAVDCGIAINPDVVVAQMEGAIGYGLGAAMRNQITLTEGVVDQDNFPDYELLRMSDMPNIDVHIVPSEVQPTGVGEPGLPPVAPALGNAIAAATGNRVTSLPFTEHGVSFV